jgi:hypothetical protein
VLIAEKNLQWHKEDEKIERHADHDAGIVGRAIAAKKPRADAHHHEGRGDVEAGYGVHQAIRERRIEDDRKPIHGLEPPVYNFVALRRLHP